MKTARTATALFLAFAGTALAASDCCADLVACCAAMMDCCP
jgi:hypothetical protein